MPLNVTMLQEDNQAAVLQAKVVTMVVLFAVSMVCGCIPLLVSLKYDWFTKSNGPNLRSTNRLVMGLLAFGGGVLFATTFMHLLPEVDENIELLQEAGELPELDIYLAALIMCCGFFMMYLVEELVHLYINSREKKTAKTSFTRVLSIRRSIQSGVPTNSDFEKPSASKEKEDHESVRKYSHAASHNHSHLTISHNEAEEDSIVAALRGLLIVLALSIHELFEGLAVGLEASEANVWYMFGAVSAHKYIIAFCIGVELLAAKTKTWLSLVYIFTFSFVSALGIGIGILLVGGSGASEAGLYSVILQGLACGTLVYVVFFEVWRQERSGLMQFAYSLLGFVVIVGLEVLIG